MVFGLFRRKKEESKAEDADDNDVYIADHIEEIYRHIKTGNTSKIKEIFPEADGFSRGSYNYIGLDWNANEDAKIFHNIMVRKFLGKTDVETDVRKRKRDKNGIKEFLSVMEDLAIRAEIEPFNTLTDYIDLAKIHEEFNVYDDYAIERFGKGSKKDLLIYLNTSSKSFNNLFKVEHKDKSKDIELLYIATKEGNSYTLIKTHRKHERNHKIEAYVGENQSIRKIDEKKTLLRIDTKKFDPEASFIFYFRPARGPGIISVKQGKKTTLSQVIHTKVNGTYEGDVEDVEKAFAKVLAGEEPLYYTFDMEDMNYIFVFHPLRGKIEDPRLNDVKEYLKGMDFDGYTLFLQQSEELFDAMHSISKNFFELLTTSGSLLPASPSYEIFVDENLVDIIGDGDHLASGIPAEPLFLMHLGASFSSQLGIFATITEDEIDQNGTVDLSKRKKIRFSKLVAPDKDDNVTYELYAGYNPETRKLGGMVLMNDGAERSSYIEVYEYDPNTKELKLINRYDIPMRKWYGVKKDPVDLMFSALEEIKKAKAGEGIEESIIIKAPYIDRFGDGSEESVDVIAMTYDGDSKMLVPSYMMRFKPVFGSQ